MMERWRLLLALPMAVVIFSSLPAWAGDGVVALQTADPSCPDESGDRYVDCGNGTVTDNDTGLVWLANANCFGLLDWFEAMAAVAGLADLPDNGVPCASLTSDECDCGLSDGSSPGEWRLPTIEEWDVMVEYADDVLGCEPTISSDAGNDCWDQQCVNGGACSFYGVQSAWYWSSSSYVPNPTGVWYVFLADGGVAVYGKGDTIYVWPVRGGQ